MVLMGNVGAAGMLATMHTYSETLARRIVAHVARASADDPTAWVMLHDAARHLKVAEKSAVLAMRVRNAEHHKHGLHWFPPCKLPAP